MARLRLFAQAREAAGTAEADLVGDSVAEVLEAARAAFGEGFAAVLAHSAIWLNGEPVEGNARVAASDEVAVLPPISGG
jgi:molybdopterin synthase sulfur carrier subunit